MTSLAAHLPARLRPRPVPPGKPGVDRPRLLQDEGKYAGLAIRAALLLFASAGAWLALRTYAGGYHALTGLNTDQHNWYHDVFRIDWIRRLIIRDSQEKVFASATLQTLVYYFASRWPRRAPKLLDRIEGRLGIASQYIDDQGLIVLFLAPFWLMVYALPGEALVALGLWATGHNAEHPLNWQVSAAGIVGSVVVGRRVAKGFAYHLQRIMIRERLNRINTRNWTRMLQGKPPRKLSPAWWMLWPLRWRCQWVVTMHQYGSDKVWRNRRLQVAVHSLVYLAIAGVVVYLTWRGQQLLKTNGI